MPFYGSFLSVSMTEFHETVLIFADYKERCQIFVLETFVILLCELIAHKVVILPKNLSEGVGYFWISHLNLQQDYLKSLGMARTAQVKRDARIGEAEARMDATIQVIISWYDFY